MKKIIFFSLLSLSVLLVACNNDDEAAPMTTDFDYHAHIMSPNTDNKHVGDTIHIHVDFESHTGETVHHANVRIYNKADSTQIFSGPDDAHVHKTGEFSFHHNFVLSDSVGVKAHTDWILEAKVWGDGAGVGEVVESIEFHVHP